MEVMVDLNLDDKYHLRYVVRLEYTRWAGRQQRSIDGFVNVLHYGVPSWFPQGVGA